MLCSAPSVMTIMNGTPSQMLVMTIATKFQIGSDIHGMGAMPNRPRIWFTAPYWKLNSVRQIWSEATAGIAQGRISIAR